MGKSCVKIKPITGSSEKHNTREIEPKYLIPLENGIENIHIVDFKIEDVRKEIEEKYFEKKHLFHEKKYFWRLLCIYINHFANEAELIPVGFVQQKRSGCRSVCKCLPCFY